MYHRTCYNKRESNQDSDNEESDDDDSEEFRFKEGHPDHSFEYPDNMKLWNIPITLIPVGRFFHLADLEISSDYPSDDVKEKREQYTKMTILIFSPIIEIESIEELQYNASYWAKFDEFPKDIFGRKVGHSPQPFEL